MLITTVTFKIFILLIIIIIIIVIIANWFVKPVLSSLQGREGRDLELVVSPGRRDVT